MAAPIKMIARDLYRLQQDLERLEKDLETAPVEQREGLEQRLRKVKAERDRMRKVLEGNKEPPVYRKPL